MGHILGVPRDPAKTIYEQAYQAVEAFRALMRQLDLPLTLTGAWHARSGAARDHGSRSRYTDRRCDAGPAGWRGRNPRVNGERDIRALYASVL